MLRFGLVSLIIVLATPLHVLLSEREADATVSLVRVLDMPVTGYMTSDPCWLSFGLGVGVVVVGLGGAGVVAYGLGGGAGLLFGSGQLAAGLVALGQLGVGVLFALVQVGVGLIGFGQVPIGGLVGGQVRIGFDGRPLLRQLNEDLNKLLRF